MIAIVVVNYNGCADTIECLESLLRLNGDDWRIVVVDNASRDGSIERLVGWSRGAVPFAVPNNIPWQALPSQRRRDPELRIVDVAAAASTAPASLISLIPSPQNLGFAGASNIGIRYALNDPACTHVWLLNNDTIVDPDAGLRLLARSESDPRVGIVGATLLYYDAPDRVQATGGHYNFLLAGGYPINHMASRDELLDPADANGRLTYVPGASMLVSRKFLDVVGPMNESYFLYFEELDWALRSKGAFIQCWEPGAVVYHKEGRSIGTSTSARPSDKSIFFMTRSLLKFYGQHRPALLPLALGRTMAKLALNLCRADWGASKAIVDALRSALTNAAVP